MVSSSHVDAVTATAPVREPQFGFPAQPSNAPYIALAAVAAVAGEVLKLPYGLASTSTDPWRILHEPLALTRLVVVLGSLYFVLAWLGVLAANRIGFSKPLIAGSTGHARNAQAVTSAILLSLVAGAACGTLLFVAALFVPVTPPSPALTWPVALLGSLGAGLNEEVLFRLFLMSVFAWIIVAISRRSMPNDSMVWLAIVTSSLLFAAAHLPQGRFVGPLTPIMVAYIIVGNSAAGGLFGWLFWRRGIVAAVIAHVTTDIILKVILPGIASFPG